MPYTSRTPIHLELLETTFRMGNARILDRASLNCELSNIILLKGCNGAGKTSFLRLLLGLEKPQSGVVRINGQVPSLARKMMGYMPQSDESLGGSLPAWSHVSAAVGAERWGITCSSRKEKALKILETCSATEFAERPFQALSGGQKQRIRLAISLASNPSLLLLDEPFSGLDMVGCRELGKLLEKLASNGCTVLLSVHGDAHINPEITREIYMEGGEIHVRL